MTHVAVWKQQWMCICVFVMKSYSPKWRHAGIIYFSLKSHSVYQIINEHGAEFTGLPVVVAVDIFPYWGVTHEETANVSKPLSFL